VKALFALLLATLPAAAQESPGVPTPDPPAQTPPSPWYAERGTRPRTPGPLDPVPETAFLLAKLLRDGGVPGFYDGQFASVAERFDELAALAGDRDINHVLRVMAVMALQEADSGPRVLAALDPLIIPAYVELGIDREVWDAQGRDDEPDFIRRAQIADLSQHARFALAKDGQSDRVLEKISEMERSVARQLDDILDPQQDSERDLLLAWKRQVVFDIGYHYQQFDDFARAAEWFRKLTDALPGKRETRWAHYNLACIAALQGRPDDAMTHLQAAWDVGFADVAWLLEDGDLKSLRERPDFQALVQTMRGQAPAGAPGAGEGAQKPPASPK
jgi:tetratricopeptide (TPR) repeat protein